MYKGAFILGNCFDEAVGEPSKTGDVEAAVEIFKEQFKAFDTYFGVLDARSSKKIKWTKTEGDPNEWYDWKGELAVRSYFEQVVPHFDEVLDVQTKIMIEDDTGNLIRGFADKIVRWKQDPTLENYNPDLDQWNGKVILFDDKFSTMKYTIPDSEQLATYSQDPNIPYEIDACGYIVVPKKFRTKKEPLVPIKITIDKVLPETVQSVFEGYAKTIEGIRLGKFDCTGCDNNPFGCDYKNYCASGGTNTKGLVCIDGKTKKSNYDKVGEKNKKA